MGGGLLPGGVGAKTHWQAALEEVVFSKDKQQRWTRSHTSNIVLQEA